MAQRTGQPSRRPGKLPGPALEVGPRRQDRYRGKTETTILTQGAGNEDKDHNGATPGMWEGRRITPPVRATED